MSAMRNENNQNLNQPNKKRWFVWILASAILILIIVVLIVYAIFASNHSEPGVYSEKRSYEYDCYILELNEEGRFAVTDILIRHNGNYYVLGGEYSLYNSKLVLISNHKDVKLTFTADGDNWIFNERKSEGMDALKFNIENKSIWEPADVFQYFRD